MPSSRGLSDLICQHVADAAFESLPARTVEFARYAVLDGLGVMLAASGISADARPFAELVLAAGGREESTLLGRTRRVPMAAAAFANGALSHALDFEDAFDIVPIHPNASLLPAALAICEADVDISGTELLAAVAVGCDLACRLALAVRRPLEAGGWYPPPIYGAFAAAAAAARLLHLDAEGIRDAFSLLLCQNVCPGEIKYSRDTVIRAVREAFPAQAAVNAALLARAGVRGFETPFEGEGGFFRLFADGQYEPGLLTDDLGQRYWIEALSFKPWPCCRGTHAFVEAAGRLRVDHAFELSEISSILVEGAEVHRMLIEPAAHKRAPRTLIDAKFSLPFTIGLALREPSLTLGSFTTAALADPMTRSLAAKCHFEAAPRFAGRAAAGGITLRLRDGREFSCDVQSAAGSPDRPLSERQLVEKFVDCAARAASPMSEPQIRSQAAKILSLEADPRAVAVLSSA